MRILLIIWLLSSLTLPPQPDNGTIPVPPALPVGLYDLQFIPTHLWPGESLVIQIGIIDNGRGVKEAEVTYKNEERALAFTYTISDTVYQTEAITWLSQVITTSSTIQDGHWRLHGLHVTDNTGRLWTTFFLGDKLGFTILSDPSYYYYIPMAMAERQ